MSRSQRDCAQACARAPYTRAPQNQQVGSCCCPARVVVLGLVLGLPELQLTEEAHTTRTVWLQCLSQHETLPLLSQTG